jgi:hypothetical protein
MIASETFFEVLYSGSCGSCRLTRKQQLGLLARERPQAHEHLLDVAAP